MLSVETAREIAEHWRPRFVDESWFQESWDRYWKMTGNPTAEGLHTWLGQDQAKDAARNVGITREPLVPQLSRWRETDCVHCAGNGYVRVDVPVSDARFGKAFQCPDCNGGRRSELGPASLPSEPVRTENWCWKCGAAENEPAALSCPNPGWHMAVPIPNLTVDKLLRTFG